MCDNIIRHNKEMRERMDRMMQETIDKKRAYNQSILNRSIKIDNTTERNSVNPKTQLTDTINKITQQTLHSQIKFATNNTIFYRKSSNKQS